MDQFVFERFKRVTIGDRSVLEPLLLASEPATCESNFLNIFVWGHIYNTQYQVYGGRAYVYLEEEDELLFPGAVNGVYPSPSELAAVSAEMRAHGKNGIIHQVKADYMEIFPEYTEYFRAEQVIEDIGEYIYSLQDLVELRGSKLAKKKNLISQFKRLYPDYRVVPLTAAQLADCRALADSWREAKLATNPDHAEGIVEEHEALDLTFDNYANLSIEGVCIYVGEKLVAFAMCSRVNSELFTIHFEKNDLNCKGSGQIINQETARALLPLGKYIDREQDLGVEGLRHAKMSYQPIQLLRNYNLIPLEG